MHTLFSLMMIRPDLEGRTFLSMLLLFALCRLRGEHETNYPPGPMY